MKLNILFRLKHKLPHKFRSPSNLKLCDKKKKLFKIPLLPYYHLCLSMSLAMPHFNTPASYFRKKENHNSFSKLTMRCIIKPKPLSSETTCIKHLTSHVIQAIYFLLVIPTI